MPGCIHSITDSYLSKHHKFFPTKCCNYVMSTASTQQITADTWPNFSIAIICITTVCASFTKFWKGAIAKCCGFHDWPMHHTSVGTHQARRSRNMLPFKYLLKLSPSEIISVGFEDKSFIHVKFRVSSSLVHLHLFVTWLPNIQGEARLWQGEGNTSTLPPWTQNIHCHFNALGIPNLQARCCLKR